MADILGGLEGCPKEFELRIKHPVNAAISRHARIMVSVAQIIKPVFPRAFIASNPKSETLYSANSVGNELPKSM